MAGNFGGLVAPAQPSPGQILLSGVITSGLIASGQVGPFALASGSVLSGHVASGQVGLNHLASGAVRSGHLASGQVGRFHLTSGCVIDLIPCEEAISGVRAVAWGSGGCFVVNAQRHSGLRMPAIGVVAGNFASGDVVPVVRAGIVGYTFSGAVASGFPGQFVYVGSGGLVINQSGFMAGASSGLGAAPTPAGSGGSGYWVQRIGVSISGGLHVLPDSNLHSGLISGLLSQV